MVDSIANRMIVHAGGQQQIICNTIVKDVDPYKRKERKLLTAFNYKQKRQDFLSRHTYYCDNFKQLQGIQPPRDMLEVLSNSLYIYLLAV